MFAVLLLITGVALYYRDRRRRARSEADDSHVQNSRPRTVIGQTLTDNLRFVSFATIPMFVGIYIDSLLGTDLARFIGG